MNDNGESTIILSAGSSFEKIGDVHPRVVPNATELRFAFEISFTIEFNSAQIILLTHTKSQLRIVATFFLFPFYDDCYSFFRHLTDSNFSVQCHRLSRLCSFESKIVEQVFQVISRLLIFTEISLSLV